MSHEERAVLWEECDRMRMSGESLPEESKMRLARSLEHIRRAIAGLQNSVVAMLRETRTVNQLADDINLLVLESAVESVLLREAGTVDSACAADIKNFALGAMNTTYEASSSMEKVAADLAGIWKSVKQIEGSLHYIRNGAQHLRDNVLEMSGPAKPGPAA